MPCHAATFSVGDTTTLITLVIFCVGIIMMFSYFLTGSIDESKEAGAIRKLLLLCGRGIRSLFSKSILVVIRAVVFDVFLQQRLYRQSQRRWLIHSLIFFPFIFRFLWGIFALTASLWFPSWLPVWGMLDKNHPATAFLFDLTGLMIIVGTVLAFLRATFAQPLRPKGLPKQDRWALGFIAGITCVGFILEGMRIAMTGWPQGSGFAFIGHGISQLFTAGASLSQAYGYIWYFHAVLTGAFFAYLPFSRLSHIIMAPFVLAMRAVTKKKHA
jgi:nitrate reductase gamma subunit